MRWFDTRGWAVLATLALIVGVAVPVGADGGGQTFSERFERRGAEEVSPSGHSVVTDCQVDGATEVETWADARAVLHVRQSVHGSQVAIAVRDARPDTYFTVWLRLKGTDSSGDSFGTNPLTDGGATPLANSADLPALLAATGSGNGNDDQPNGFRTDALGNATLRLRLDFPLVGGAYPFQRFPGWDPSDPRLPAADPAIYPVAIAGPQAPYTLRIVSHCTDDIGHGLQSGPREWWFDWTIAA